KQAGRNPDHVSICTRIGDGAKEFHELGRADDGVGNAGSLDQFLLSDLGAEIAIVAAVVSDDRQRDMMPDARCGFSREKIAARSLKEFHPRLVFKTTANWRRRPPPACRPEPPSSPRR